MKRIRPIVQWLEDRVVPAGTGLSGQYFNNADFTSSVLTRTDSRIEFNWGTGSPDASVGADTFSVRWTGELEPRFTETYTFTATADDGVSLWVGDRLILGRDKFSANVASLGGSIALTAGVRVPIRLEYVEQTSSASVRLAWESASQGREIIPTSALYPGTALDDRGSIRQETWTGIGTIAALTANASYPAKPANRDSLVTFESLTQNAGDAIARRISGWIVPSITGNYTFAVSGDDQAELWLSTDATEANSVKVAFTSAATTFRNFTANASQQSAPIALVAGTKYFIKALHADAGGTDHFSVGWQRPGDASISVIPGDVLIPAGVDTAQPTQANVLNTLATAHPYLFTTPERFSRVQQLSTGPLAAWWASLKSRADGFLTAAVNYYHLPDGVRLLSISRSVLDRVGTLALAYQVSGDTAYAERAWLELDAINNFPDWHPPHFLDVAEMTQAAAIGYDWLYNYWSQSRRDAIRTAIINFGLVPGLAQYTSNAGWTQSTSNNWNFVCNGGLTAGALAIAAENVSQSSDILNRALNSARPMMAHFTTDNGGWYEGPGYWDYASDYLIQFLDGLETALGSDFAIGRVQGFDRTGMVPVQMVGPTKLSFNFADAGAGNLRGPQLFWLARRFNEPIYAAHERGNTTTPEPLDLLRYDDRGLSAAALGTPLDEPFLGPTKANTFSPMEVVSLRQDWTSQASWLGFKGAGKIGDSHGHLDAGSFVFDSHGQRWAHDLGSDDYNLPNYFGSARWTYYRLRAEGQNTLVINPTSGNDQVVNAAAPIITFSDEPGADRAMTVADLTAAYTGTSRVWRGMQLLNGREELLIQDEIVASTAVNGWWFMHVKLDPSQIAIAPDGRSAILTQNGERLYVKIVTGSGTITLRDPVPLPTSPYPSGQNANTGVKKLAINLTNVTNERLAVWMVPLSPGEAIPTSDPAIVPLADWGKTLNDPPKVASFTVAEDTPLDIDLLTAISDFETPANRLAFSIAGATNGTAVLLPDGHTVRFTPAADYSGPASVQVNVTDEGIDPRLLAAFDFEPPTATLASTAVDSSKNDREGTLSTIGTGAYSASTSVPTALTGRSTRSLELTENGNGNGARLSRTMADINFNTSNWSFSTWFKRRDTANDDLLFYLGDSDGFGSINELHLGFLAGTDTLALRHYAGVSPDVDLTATVLPNVWTQATITVSTAGTMSLYVNGTLVGSDSAFTLAMATTQGPILGGTGSTTVSTGRWFDGWLDDAALFNVALPASDAAKLALGSVAQLGGSTSVATSAVTVTPVNDAPVATGSTSRTTWRDTAIDVDLRTIATDKETPANQLLFAVTGATNGTAVLLADGVTVRFTPNTGYTGPATFTFTAIDSEIPASSLAMYTFEPPDTATDGFSDDISGGLRTGTLSLVGTGTFSDDASSPAALGRFGTRSLKLTNPSDGNAARLVSGVTGSTIDFNSSAWSVSGWFNRATSTGDDNVFYLGTSDGFGANELWITGPSGATSLRLQHDVTTNTTDVSITKTGVTLNAWHHMAVTFAPTGGGAGTLSFYVDGVLAGTDSTFVLGLPAASSAIFGGHASTTFATSRWFDGKLDDLALFSTALTAAEVGKLATRDLTHAFGLTLGPVTVNLTVTVPPSVTGLVVNGGNSQRSRITSVQATFATAFDASLLQGAGAITLTSALATASVGATGSSGRITVSPAFGTASVYTLSFDNANGSAVSGSVESGSLADGYWRLAVPALGYQSAANDANLRRLFGDGDANGTVDATDFGLFGIGFGGTAANSPFDFDSNSTVDATDFAAFGGRFGTTL